MSVSLEKKSFYGFPTITERLLNLKEPMTADSLMPRAYFGRRLSVLRQPMSGPVRPTSGRQAVLIPFGLRQPMSAQPADGASERSDRTDLTPAGVYAFKFVPKRTVRDAQ
jgi:hypothetical protein